MNTFKMLLSGAAMLALLSSCGSDSAPTDSDNNSDTLDTSSDVVTPSNASDFSISVSEATFDFSKARELQSFVYGDGGNGDMLLIGGRTNGFHGFSSPGNSFPYSLANTHMYVYNYKNNSVDSLSVDSLSKQLSYMFASTNMQHIQEGNNLYICGGYVQLKDKDPKEWETLNLFVKVDIAALIAAVKAKDGQAANNAIVWTWNDYLWYTGGEMFKLSDGNFYLCVGHNYTGNYANPSATKQVYHDSVFVFSIDESVADTVTLNASSFVWLSDHLTDSLTQYRRRDLVVVPAVEQNGDIGLSMYAGVFTYPYTGASNPMKDSSTLPFKYPIYISAGGGTPTSTVDSSFWQSTNCYSAANVLMYDPTGVMYTTIIGGIGDAMNNDDFTKKVLTLQRDYSGGTASGVTTANYEAALTEYVGSEAVFIIDPASGITMHNGSTEIFDYSSIPSGTSRLGYMYGGIKADSAATSATQGTQAIRTFYEVSITKN